MNTFVDFMREFQRLCYENSAKHGFWDEGEQSFTQDGCMGEQPCIVKTKHWNFGEKIALIHSELSEALEKHRKTIGKGLPDAPDEHCPEFGGIAIELADAMIRIGDLAEKMKVDLGAAIVAKMSYNASRPPKHGKAY